MDLTHPFKPCISWISVFFFWDLVKRLCIITTMSPHVRCVFSANLCHLKCCNWKVCGSTFKNASHMSFAITAFYVETSTKKWGPTYPSIQVGLMDPEWRCQRFCSSPTPFILFVADLRDHLLLRLVRSPSRALNSGFPTYDGYIHCTISNPQKKKELCWRESSLGNIHASTHMYFVEK